jgi:subtilisin family serine protease
VIGGLLLVVLQLTILERFESAERVRIAVAASDAASSRRLSASLSEVTELGDSGVFIAAVTRDELVALAADRSVLRIEPDDGGSGHMGESVPLIGGNTVQLRGYDGSGITVAIIDTGVDATHPDLIGNVVDEQCFCATDNGGGCCPNGTVQQSGPGAAADDHGHGSHVAGIIASRGIIAPRGMAPGVRIIAVKAMDRDNRFASFADVYKALDWVSTTHPEARVVNMSLGTFNLYDGYCDQSPVATATRQLVAAMRRRGVLVVASSGNDGEIERTPLPACVTDVVAVGSVFDSPLAFYNSDLCTVTDIATDDVSCFSNGGPTVDLLAPGAVIDSVAPLRRIQARVGTSMSAPHVAGSAALLMQAFPAGSADTVEQILKRTGRPVFDRRTGLLVPRVDVSAAVSSVVDRPVRRRATR